MVVLVMSGRAGRGWSCWSYRSWLVVSGVVGRIGCAVDRKMYVRQVHGNAQVEAAAGK
jgi:hypothetical protein